MPIHLVFRSGKRGVDMLSKYTNWVQINNSLNYVCNIIGLCNNNTITANNNIKKSKNYN